jgi:CBS domain-containing protein
MSTYRYNRSWVPEGYRDTARGRHADRNFIDRASDEVASWFGDERAERRRQAERQYAPGRDEGRQDYRARADRLERVHEVMSQRVASVHPGDPVTYAARVMRDEDCGALPVVDRSGRIVGMVTDRDIACRVVADGEDLRHARVGDCMTDEVFACHFDSPIHECMGMMAHHQVRRVPVVDDYNRVVGIVSQGDLALHAARHASSGERRAVADVVSAVSEPTGRPFRD